MNKPYKTLYRSRNNRIVGGVAAGLGEYLGIDPTVVRLLFVLVAIVGWIAPAVIVYLVMLFVIPEEPLGTVSTTAPVGTPVSTPSTPVESQPVEAEQRPGAVSLEPSPDDQAPG